MSTKNPESEYSENQWGPQEISFSFAISGDKLVLNDLAKAFNVKPSWSFGKGEIFNSKTGPQERPTSVWAITSEGVIFSDNIDDHFEFILKILESNRIFVEQLAKDPDLYLGFRIFVVPKSGIIGFVINSKMLQRLTNFCTDINFSFIGIERE